MSSTILFKFRSGTTFEALPLPGTSARLFDVKRAIVLAKKLDAPSALEFDLSVRDATTNQEYADESMLLPRGTRVVVQRLPAPKGHGFLARMARVSAGLPGTGGGGGALNPHLASAASTSTSSSTHHNTSASFYTIDSRARDDDEFVAAPALGDGGGGGGGGGATSDEQELAALRAATDAASTSRAFAGSGGGPVLSSSSSMFPRGPGGRPVAGSAGVVPGTLPPGSRHPNAPGAGGGAAGGYRPRPNADPELRDQEKQLLPKKRATGIPRTFLSLTAPGNDDGGDGSGGGGAPLLQPNAIGFEELVNRRGGQSESAGGTSRDLDYALKVTATGIPEYLQCAICHNVVKDAMILPWDPEGRTTCESCIRDALAKSGFRCPLTGQEGVSPDDLLPNAGLRRAADMFVKSVFDKLQEIEQQVEDEDDQGAIEDAGADEKETLEGDTIEKGVLVSRRTSLTSRKKHDDDDPFGVGDADFGGDVFVVPSKKEEKQADEVKTSTAINVKPDQVNQVSNVPVPPPLDKESSPSHAGGKESRHSDAGSEKHVWADEQSKTLSASEDKADRNPLPSTPSNNDSRARSTSPPPARSAEQQSTVGGGIRREPPKRRGPPMGYAMGPAGYGAIVGPPDANDNNGRSPRDAGRDRRSEHYEDSSARSGGGGTQYDRSNHGRGDLGGRRGGGRFGDRYDSRGGEYRDNHYDHDNRGTKRPRSEPDTQAEEDSRASSHRDRYSRDEHASRGGGRGGGRWEDRGGRGGGRGFRGGGYRGGYRGRR